MVTLIKAVKEDLPLIHKLQLESFKALLKKYKDYSTNPGTEGIERIEARFNQKETTYYLIMYNDNPVGAIRLYYCQEANSCRISPMFIHPDYQNKSLGQEAVHVLESLYPHASVWNLDTIVQEDKLCHFYEKLGYKDTGKREQIKEGMDLIYYSKKNSHDQEKFVSGMK